MIACTSPAGTSSDTPFRIGLSATVAWRFLIVSIVLFDHNFVSLIGDGRAIDFRPLVDRIGLGGIADFDGHAVATAFAGDTMVAATTIAAMSIHHPTLPSKLIPNSFCASTANSIGSCLSTSRAKPLTISATAL